MEKIRAAVLATLLSVPSLAHAQAYKCKQADGSLGFQDHPCQTGAAGSLIALPPAQGYAPASLGPSGRADASAQQAQAHRTQVMAENKVIRCNAAHRQLGMLQEQRRVFTRDSAGNRMYLDDKDRPAVISAAQEREEAVCE